jgi:transposase-like protein
MSRKKFNAEFKANAINYRIRNGHKSLEQIAKDLGIGTSTLSKWISDYSQENHQSSKPKLSDEQLELKRLRQENQDLKEVNEILKKAHKYFVSQSL